MSLLYPYRCEKKNCKNLTVIVLYVLIKTAVALGTMHNGTLTPLKGVNMAATIRDIREKTGLSLATISKYLNGGNVLPHNRELIEKAIDELHYEVNELARGLVTNRTRTVGVLVYNIECLFVGNVLHYLGQELRKCGYGMLICDSDNEEEMEVKNLQFLLSRKVDGIIVLAVNLSGQFLSMVKENGVPVVLMDRAFRDVEFDCVKIDNRAAAYRAVNELIRRNHRKIAVIGSNVEYTGLEREKGYREAMREAGIEVPDEYVRMGRHSFELGYENMKNLLELPDRPSAVFMGNYETTLGGVMAVNESRFSCPDDISLIGFDNLLLSQVITPRLWVVVQPMRQMSERAVQLLLMRMKNEKESMAQKISFSAEIQEGQSIRTL